jgi:hypothetical protein
MLPQGNTNPTLTRLCVGGLTGIMFNLVFFPFDVIKARSMVTSHSSGKLLHDNIGFSFSPNILYLTLTLSSHSQGGPLQIARALMLDAGWRGFYRGIGVVLLRSFPVNALGFLTLQTSQDLLATIEL